LETSIGNDIIGREIGDARVSTSSSVKKLPVVALLSHVNMYAAALATISKGEMA
jgi:hypothetical protein